MQIDVKTLFNLTFEKLIKSEEEALKIIKKYRDSRCNRL